jgi:16S rRNA (guanine966-N2)-methyltransferase
MRVIAGKAKGRKLEVGPGLGVRPLMDRIKVSLFDSIGPELIGKKILDLFAGSGGFGIEALSRGADKAWFVDSSGELIQTLDENIRHLGFIDQAQIICSRAEDFVGGADEQFDIIFIDPPFKDFKAVISPIIEAIIERKLLAERGFLITRSFHKDTYEHARLNMIKEKKYGENKVVFYQISNPAKEAV